MNDTTSNARTFLELNELADWVIEKGDGKQIANSGEFSDLTASLNHFTKSIELIPVGAYTLRGKKAGRQNSTYQYFPFSKALAVQPTQPPAFSFGNPMDMMQMLQKVKDDARREFEQEQRLKDLEKVQQEILTTVKALADSVKKLTDDDDENDGSAVRTLTEITEAIGKGGELLESFQGFGKMAS